MVSVCIDKEMTNRMYYKTHAPCTGYDEMNFVYDWSERTGGTIKTVNIRQWKQGGGIQYWTVTYGLLGKLHSVQDGRFAGVAAKYPTMVQALRAANRVLRWAVVQ